MGPSSELQIRQKIDFRGASIHGISRSDLQRASNVQPTRHPRLEQPRRIYHTPRPLHAADPWTGHSSACKDKRSYFSHQRVTSRRAEPPKTSQERGENQSSRPAPPRPPNTLRSMATMAANGSSSGSPDDKTNTTTERLPMPSRNPLPLSASQEAQVRDIFYDRVRRQCADEIKGTKSLSFWLFYLLRHATSLIPHLVSPVRPLAHDLYYLHSTSPSSI